MIKFFYKIVGIIFTIFIFFIFSINFNFLRFKESLILRIYYSIKVNLIYFIFYFIYIFIYYKYLFKDNNKNIK